MAKNSFEHELAIFSTEEEIAQQYFFSYLSIRSGDIHVIRAMNTNSLFWITTRDALLLAAFIALGRIFDQNSKHNIDRLMSAALKDISAFSRIALADRKRRSGLTSEEAAAYVEHSYELSASDLRILRKEIKRWRQIYEARYKQIRDKFFAHREISSVEEANNLMVNTNIDEMKELFGFMSDLEAKLWAAFHNGISPHREAREFNLTPDRISGRDLPGEKVFRQGQAVLKSVLPAN
jgi:hypothetical protein